MEDTPISTPPQNSSKRKRNIIVITAALIILCLAAYYIFLKTKKPAATFADGNNNVDARKDSTQVAKGSNQMDEEDMESPYGTYYFTQDVNTGGHQFRFGDKVCKDYQKSTANNAIFYLSEPDAASQIAPKAYSIHPDLLADESDIESYRRNFSLQPFNALDIRTKKLILEKDNSDNIDYSITQNADRAKRTICTGDFDDDGIQDVAVILDNNEEQRSRLLIICTNAATGEQYLAFAENYADKVAITAVKKGTPILMNDEASEGPTAASIDGIYLRAENLDIAILYDKPLQKFKTWYQQ